MEKHLIRAFEMEVNDLREKDVDEYMNTVLEIERVQYLSSGWRTKKFILVTGTGGPHVELDTDYGFRAYWGGDTLERDLRFEGDDIVAKIDEIFEYLEEVE